MTDHTLEAKIEMPMASINVDAGKPSVDRKTLLAIAQCATIISSGEPPTEDHVRKVEQVLEILTKLVSESERDAVQS